MARRALLLGEATLRTGVGQRLRNHPEAHVVQGHDDLGFAGCRVLRSTSGPSLQVDIGQRSNAAHSSGLTAAGLLGPPVPQIRQCGRTRGAWSLRRLTPLAPQAGRVLTQPSAGEGAVGVLVPAPLAVPVEEFADRAPKKASSSATNASTCWRIHQNWS